MPGSPRPDAPTDTAGGDRDSMPVALVSDASAYVGPALARELAAAGFRLALGDPDPSLVRELDAAGVEHLDVTGVRNLAVAGNAGRLVEAALARYGRIDSAVAFSGRIVTGRLLESSRADLDAVVDGCLVAPYEFLMAVLPPMVAATQGQVLVLTSAAGARPVPGVPLYSAVRAGATHLVKNAAAEVARHGVQVNALGTNFMDFPEFRRAAGADDPGVRAAIEQQVPLKRLGTLEECAHFCMAFLDGGSRFTTGQFVSYSGGWS